MGATGGTVVRRWLGATAVAAGAFGVMGAACTPQPKAPDPGTVDVAGDSLTIQAFYNGGFGEGAPDDLRVFAGNGWSVAHAQPFVTRSVNNGRPQVLVIALGTNDVSPYNGGWDIGDYARFHKLINTPHPDACVVVVTPGYGPTLKSAFKTGINRARVDLRRIMSERPRTVEADWHAVVRDHPEYIASDGIHLSGFAAWRARSALYWQGVAKCAGYPPSSAAVSSSSSGPAGPSSSGSSGSSGSTSSSLPSQSPSSTSVPPPPPTSSPDSAPDPSTTSPPPTSTSTSSPPPTSTTTTTPAGPPPQPDPSGTA